MSLPETMRPIERDECVRRLFQIADMFDAVDASSLPMLVQFQLSRIKTAAEWTARCVQRGFDLPINEKDAA